MFEVNEGDVKVVMQKGTEVTATVEVRESGESLDVDITFKGNLENLCVYVNGEPWALIEPPKRDTRNDARLIKLAERADPSGSVANRQVWRDRHGVEHTMPPAREDGHRYGM